LTDELPRGLKRPNTIDPWLKEKENGRKVRCDESDATDVKMLKLDLGYKVKFFNYLNLQTPR